MAPAAAAAGRTGRNPRLISSRQPLLRPCYKSDMEKYAHVMSGRTDDSRVARGLPARSASLLAALGFATETDSDDDDCSVSSDASDASGEGAPVQKTRVVRMKPPAKPARPAAKKPKRAEPAAKKGKPAAKKDKPAAKKDKKAARTQKRSDMELHDDAAAACPAEPATLAPGKRGRAPRDAKEPPLKQRGRRESTSAISSDSDSYDAEDVTCAGDDDDEYTCAAAASPAERRRSARPPNPKSFGSDWVHCSDSDGENTSSAPRVPPVKQARCDSAVARPPPAAAAAVPQVLPVVAALPVVAVALCDSSPPSQGCPTLRAPAPVAVTTPGSSNMDAPCSDPGDNNKPTHL